MTDTMDAAAVDADLAELDLLQEEADSVQDTHSSQLEQAASTAGEPKPPPSTNPANCATGEHKEAIEVPVVARRPPVGRKKAIAAVLATPVAQDANSAPDSSTGAAKQDVRAPPKVPAKKAVAKAAATGGTKPVDQDLLQAIVGAAEDAQTSGKSRASKNSSAATATKPAGKKAKASSGKENVKPAAAKKAKSTPDKKPRKKSDKPRNKSGYNMFCAAQRPILKEEKPDLSMTDVTKELATLWGAKTEEEKKVSQDEADAANALQQEEYAANGPKEDKKARSTPGGKGKGKATAGKKRGNKADKEEEGAEDSEECPEDAVKSDESDDDSDRENCDWDSHPAEAILAVTEHKKFIVKRKSLDLTEYGLVDAQAVKRQRLEPDVKTPVTLQQLEDFEQWQGDFVQTVKDSTSCGNFELDNLGKESPLETCYYLGKMVDKNYPLAKPKKGWDKGATFPILGLSLITQRLLNVERTKAQALNLRIAELEQRIAELEK